MKTKLYIILGSLLALIVLLSGCIQEVTKKQSKEELIDEILNIGEAVPEGWNYTITQNSEETSIPHGLWKPVAIVNFTNFNEDFGYYPGVKTDKKYNPSLLLYFYDIAEKQKIMMIIDQEKIYSWCIPIYFDETKKYIIVTSGCYINSGVFTEEAKNYYFPLEKSLKGYFDKFK